MCAWYQFHKCEALETGFQASLPWAPPGLLQPQDERELSRLERLRNETLRRGWGY
jgi:hypothetical protein